MMMLKFRGVFISQTHISPWPMFMVPLSQKSPTFPGYMLVLLDLSSTLVWILRVLNLGKIVTREQPKNSTEMITGCLGTLGYWCLWNLETPLISWTSMHWRDLESKGLSPISFECPSKHFTMWKWFHFIIIIYLAILYYYLRGGVSLPAMLRDHSWQYLEKHLWWQK